MIRQLLVAGVHDLKPYVHSDCGGDIGNAVRGTAGNLIRWSAHCAYGSILRYHGGDHRIWNYDTSTIATIRNYLHARYRLLPSCVNAQLHITLSNQTFVRVDAGAGISPRGRRRPDPACHSSQGMTCTGRSIQRARRTTSTFCWTTS